MKSSLFATALFTGAALSPAALAQPSATESNWLEQSLQMRPRTDHCDRMPDNLWQDAHLSAADVAARIVQCHNALAYNVDAHRHRRGAYNGAAAFGGMGALISAGQHIQSTANIWAGVALAPLVVDGSFDRGGYAALDAMTAEAMSWILRRASDMQGRANDLEARARAIDGLTNCILSAPNVQDCTTVRNCDVMGAPRVYERNGRYAADIQALLGTAARVQEMLCSRRAGIEQSLPYWAAGNYNYILRIYSQRKGEIQPSPEQTLRTILALPIQKIANVINGSASTSERLVRTMDDARIDLGRVDATIPVAPPAAAQIPAAPSLQPSRNSADMLTRDLCERLRNELVQALADMQAVTQLGSREETPDFSRPPPPPAEPARETSPPSAETGAPGQEATAEIPPG